MARACILWLIGTHIDKVPKLAPDLLRKVAKTFCDEADCVKVLFLLLSHSFSTAFSVLSHYLGAVMRR
jgi:AP-3 complex subunit beta